MKKLLILIPYSQAFRESFLLKLTSNLKKSNIETVVVYGEHADVKHKKVDISKTQLQVIQSPLRKRKIFGFNIITQPDLHRIVRQEKADGLVFLYNPGMLSYWRIYFACLLRKIPIGLWSCGYTRPELSFCKVQFRKLILDLFFKKAKVNIAYSSLHKEYLEKISIASNAIFVAQNTINVDEILESREAYHKPIKKDAPIEVLFVGALIKNKRLDISMIAVDRLISEGYDVVFNIVGKGEMFEELQVFRNSLINKGKINLLGAKYGDDVANYFSNSDVFLLTGSGGLAINEAMAYGLPIISTIGDGTIRDLIDGNGFLLSDTANTDEVYAKLKLFLDSTAEQREAMGNKSIEILKEKATLKNMVEQYSKAVDYLLK